MILLCLSTIHQESPPCLTSATKPHKSLRLTLVKQPVGAAMIIVKYIVPPVVTPRGASTQCLPLLSLTRLTVQVS